MSAAVPTWTSTGAHGARPCFLASSLTGMHGCFYSLHAAGSCLQQFCSIALCTSPTVLGIDRFTTDLPTQGGPVNIILQNVGFGRHAYSLPMNMTYANSNYSYVAQACQVAWNGSVVSCIAPPGVSRDLRWTGFLFGVQGYLSASNVVLNYKPPRLYNIYSVHNNTLTAPSSGGEVFNVSGVNFGPISMNAMWWVRYSPQAHPDIMFYASCQLVIDHFLMLCTTGPQAGSRQYWTINVAGQISETVFTSTRLPNVTSVSILQIGEGLRVDGNGVITGAIPIRSIGRAVAANVSLGLSTTGGGIVLLRGTYVD